LRWWRIQGRALFDRTLPAACSVVISDRLRALTPRSLFGSGNTPRVRRGGVAEPLPVQRPGTFFLPGITLMLGVLR
jgi:hypothetical protein